ncbi:Ig-like domain-containing domain [Spirosoma endophyticum]|uniref:Polysaccharide lyase family 4, domain II n=1 Tax=Spirosoma endophyticum TaxID=662367 RepID=A0A1I1IAW2_9BACT|nr:Ig-like domain-containing domain [Spirosoma endophyticum]SFC30913.1 Polysaccharide lyase family 4, domain II [Spirosoma endophyticum]
MTLRHLVLGFLLVLPILLQNCAQVAQPPGGKKDTLAPKLVSSMPAARERNYTGKSVELEFDEYVNSENLQQKITITPQDSNTYVVKSLPLGVRLNFNKPFLPNTTYTIDFADGIKDITERNIAKNTKVVFSTGPTIDSLYLTGNIVDDESRLPILGFVVGLFASTDTLPINRKRPQYFARTDSSGNYRIENVKAGPYKVYGFDDKDLNLVNNTPGERVAFRDSVLNLNRNYTDVNLVAFRGYGKPRISRRERTDETLGLELSSGIASYTVKYGKAAYTAAASTTATSTTTTSTSAVSTTAVSTSAVSTTTAPATTPSTSATSSASANDTLISFLENPKMIRLYRPANRAAGDTLYTVITAIDSVGNSTDLRERIYFSPLKTKAKNRTSLTFQLSPPSNEPIDNNLEFTLVFNKPVFRWYTDLIVIGPDSTKPFKLTPENLIWSNNFSHLVIKQKTNPKDTLLFRLQKGAFISVQGDTLARYSTRYLIAEEDSYGLIAGHVNPTTVGPAGKNFIVELLDEKYKVIRSSYGTLNYSFGRLRPGQYRVRLIIDANANRKRDIGNVQKGIQPERMIYSPGMEEGGIIRVKQNFELTDIDF